MHEDAQDMLNALAGWVRAFTGGITELAGVLTGNDELRRRGHRSRLVGLMQRRLGARAAAIEQMIERWLARVPTGTGVH